ncbi:DUF1960-domain-containing protein [Meredithblackwellia eburnea MCA 4105]
MLTIISVQTVVKTTHKMVYKPDSMSTDEFIIIVADADAAKKWIDGAQTHPFLPLLKPRTIPLVEIVDSFDVFHSGQGSQGLLNRPSKQQLHAVFESVNENDIVETVLTKGRLIASDAPIKFGSKNDSKGGVYSSSRGSVGGGR